MSKLIIILATVIIVIGLTYAGIKQITTTDNDNSTVVPTESTETASTTANWREFNNEALVEGWRMVMLHPPEVEITHPIPYVISVKYIGPNSEPATEITDGYTITITANPTASLDAYVSQARKINDVQTVQFNSYDAKKYQTVNELGGTVDHTVFVIGENDENKAVIDISTSVYGDQNSEYRDTLNLILESLTFEEIE